MKIGVAVQLVTFYLELGRVPDLGGGVRGDTCIITGVLGRKVGNTEKTGIRIQLGYVCDGGQFWWQGKGALTIFQPGNGERWITRRDPAHRPRPHPLGKSLLEGKWLNYRGYWKRSREKREPYVRARKRWHQNVRTRFYIYMQ